MRLILIHAKHNRAEKFGPMIPILTLRLQFEQMQYGGGHQKSWTPRKRVQIGLSLLANCYYPTIIMNHE